MQPIGEVWPLLARAAGNWRRRRASGIFSTEGGDIAADRQQLFSPSSLRNAIAWHWDAGG
jgi:hypothetical protein